MSTASEIWIVLACLNKHPWDSMGTTSVPALHEAAVAGDLVQQKRSIDKKAEGLKVCIWVNLNFAQFG